MFRFVHSSDWHLPFPLDEFGGRWRLKQKLGRISYRHKRRLQHTEEVIDAAFRSWQEIAPDRFVVSGDLVNFALPVEFEAAARRLNSLEETAPITLVPGNHDALVRAGLAEQVSHWGHNLSSDGEVSWPSVTRHGPVAFIGLSSSMPTPPFIAQGRVSKPQLEALEEILPQLASEGYFRVVTLHHPPQPDAISWRGALRKADALRDVLQRHGAELVLHGHLHHPVEATLEGPERLIPIFGVGSASSARINGRAERGHFYLFTLRQDDAVKQTLELTDYFYEEAKDCFEAGRTRTVDCPSTGGQLND